MPVNELHQSHYLGERLFDSSQDRKNEIHSQSGVEFTPEKRPALLRIAATFTLGQWIGALELPTATAVAIPMISHEVDRRFL